MPPEFAVRVTQNGMSVGIGGECERVLQAAARIPHHRRADIERSLDTITYSPEVDRLRYALQDFWNAL